MSIGNSGQFKKGMIPYNKGKKYPTGICNAKDITGKKYNRWTAIQRTTKGKLTYWNWIFRCECGKEKELQNNYVTLGLSKSCGCLKLEKLKIRPSTHTENSKKLLSEAHKGEKNHMWKGGITAKKIALSKLHLGIKTGENHWKWIKDRTQLKTAKDSEERRSSRYKDWRRNICSRDGWKCKISNNDCNGRLEVHHILSFTKYPELKYDINNGIALCHFHHPRKREDEINLSPYFKELVMNIQ